MLPQLAKGEANKIWVIPSEFTTALSNLSGAVGRAAGGEAASPSPPPPSTDDGEHAREDAPRSLPPGGPPAP
jgi:hypothetical protein